MNFEFEIENFQSIERATFTFSGFTTFVGPSNLGKSAVMRALKAWAYNDMHPSYVREGTKECRLLGRWSADPGHGIAEVEFRRGKTLNQYRVRRFDGSEMTYPKIGKDTPAELKAMGFCALTTERDDEFNLNFQPQLDGFFLISAEDVKLTSFINAIFGIAPYERALRSINAVAMTGQKEYDALSDEIQADERALEEETAELVRVTQACTAIEAAAAEVERREAALARYESGLGRVREIADMVERRDAARAAAARFRDVADHLATVEAYVRRAVDFAWRSAEGFALAQREAEIRTGLLNAQRASFAVTNGGAHLTRAVRCTLALARSRQLDVHTARTATALGSAHVARERLSAVSGQLTVVARLDALHGALRATATAWGASDAAAQRAGRVVERLGAAADRTGRMIAVESARSEMVRLGGAWAAVQIEGNAAVGSQGEVETYRAYIRASVPRCPVCAGPLDASHGGPHA